jgi:hypothetical protein
VQPALSNDFARHKKTQKIGSRRRQVINLPCMLARTNAGFDCIEFATATGAGFAFSPKMA